MNRIVEFFKGLFGGGTPRVKVGVSIPPELAEPAPVKFVYPPKKPKTPMFIPMNISQNGMDFIMKEEGFRSKPYFCSGKKLTIGWGHVILPNESHLKKGITKEQGRMIFANDIQQFVKDVNKLVKVPLTQNQFDALVSFAFNVGSDIDMDNIAEGLGDSTLLKKLNRLDYAGAAGQFGKWVFADGKKQPGLVKRRAKEKALFLA